MRSRTDSDRYRRQKAVRIGVAEDEAFCFFMQIICVLERWGQSLFNFHLHDDKQLPGDLDGLFLCGGYPELNGKAWKKIPGMSRIDTEGS